MAPDKIYITPGQIQDDELALYNYDDCVTYIRKDALLEWAKETKEIMSLGGHVSIDDIISKIELL